MSDAPVPFETLLAHEGFVRGLARSLVRDESRADDVVQETWVTALRDPPREGGSVRSWLGSVVRSRASDARKSERRRDARERATARSEGTDSVADAVAATEIHRRVVAAVMALDEPYRASVILRYFEGLPPREVGARTGVPAETARTRIKRGLEMLRARLDRDHGGDRRRWVAALLPIAGLAGGERGNVQGSTRGGQVMGTTTKLAAGAAFVLLFGLVIWWWAGDGDAAPPEVATAPDADSANVPGRANARAARPARAETPDTPAAETAAPSPPPVVTTSPGALVRLRFVDESGAVLSPETVRQRWGGGVASPTVALLDDRVLRGVSRRDQLAVVTGAGESLRPVALDGAAEDVRLRERLPKGRWRLVVLPGAADSTLTRPFTVGGDTEDLAVDVLLPGTALRLVRVLDAESRSPVAGATLTPYFEIGDDGAFVAGGAATTDASGECRLPVGAGVAATYQRPPTWWATAPGRCASFQVRADPNAAADAAIVVSLKRTFDVEGEAFLPDGSPAAGRLVIWRRKGHSVRATCDAEGRFRLTGLPTDRNRQEVFLVEDRARGVLRSLEAEAKPGTTASVRFGGVDLGRASLTLNVTAGGRAVEGLMLFVWGTTAGGSRTAATTGPDGRAAIAGLPAGEALQLMVALADLRVVDDYRATPAAFAPLAPGEERTLALDLPAGTLRVRVVGADGKAVPGTRVWARPADRAAPGPAGWQATLGDGRFADDDGAAVLVGLPTGVPCEVQAFDDVTGAQSKTTAVPGTSDAPVDVTLTLTR